jgi:long-chain fatty acid transport protein
MMRDPRGKLALGFGLVGLSSFGADFAASSSSVLFAPVPTGVGRIFADYREVKIPVAMAYQVTPKLAIGASINVYLASFGISPLPYRYFDTSRTTGQRYYPSAGRLTNSFALSGQVGFYYEASPTMSVGGSFTLPQNFAPYKWNSTYADPTSVDYGQARTLEFDLDGPMVATMGIALKPSAKTQIAIDGMFTKYTGVNGLGGPGGVVNGVIDPFGWRNVWTIKAGVQHQVTDKMTVRAGYNYSQTPIRAEVVSSSIVSPLTFQHHFCGGVGVKMFPFLEMVASFRFSPRQHIVGPYSDVQGIVRGTIDESNKSTSGLIGMSFKF